MTYWCCAQTVPARESAAQHFLQIAGYTTYLPRLRVMRPSHGRRIETKPVLFPSYLFVLITEGWWAARWCPNVIRLLTAGEGPMHVPDAVVDAIRSRERNGLVELPRRDRLKPGDRVKITRGPLREQIGLYEGMRGNERVLVLLALLGSSQKVELAVGDIEAVRTNGG
jgi:transcriptional antiterminator RfaH